MIPTGNPTVSAAYGKPRASGDDPAYVMPVLSAVW